MKITALKPYPITYGHRGIFLVKVETDSGVYGWGEGGISGRELGEAAIVQSFEPHLLGQDPRRIDHCWQLMARAGFFEPGTVMGGALSAIDVALWDILGKHLNVPCWQLLGGRSRDRVETYCHAHLETAKDKVAQGWRHLRFSPEPPGIPLPPAPPPSGKVFTFDHDTMVLSVIEQMTKARELLGPDIKLCNDFHTRFNPGTAAQACNAIEHIRPFFIEDPIRGKNPQAYAELRKRTRVPIASGEACSSKWEFQQLIEQDSIDYARVDLCNVGGLTEARKVAAMAETHYIDLIPHCATGPVGYAATLQLVTAIPNFAVMEYAGRHDQAPDLFHNDLKFEPPFFAIPSAPGIGVEIDEAKLAQHPWKAWIPPLFVKNDGAFTNW